MAYNPRDHFFRKAKEQNFAARSVFKLEEIDNKYKLVHSGAKILDMGAAPGSWSQYASRKIGDQGKILGVDLTVITVKLPNATFIQADLRDANLASIFEENGFAPPFDFIMSDMAPKTTGIKSTDQARSTELCLLALDTCKKYLKPGGNFVVKFFHSDDFKDLKDNMLKEFHRVEALRPESTRSISKEIFLIGLKKK
jgi:23S rRNA (uridine2552-2'-O)-methyltransferase